MNDQKRDPAPLAGALFVVLVLIAFIPLGGDSPDGDESARNVISFYSDNQGREIIAAVVLALSTVPLLAFSATLRDRFTSVLPGRSTLPTFTFGAGVVTAAGFLGAAGIHFALADYAGDINPAATQALNALDSDFFLPFSTGLAAMVLGISLLTIRTRYLPTWLGWFGILMFIISFTPVGFIAFGLSGIYIIVVSVMLYRRDESAATPAAATG